MGNEHFDIKLVVCDMDGTFLSTDWTVCEENKRAVADLAKKKIPFVIVTGRMIAMVQEYVRQLQLTTPIVGYNGGLISLASSSSVLFSSCMTTADVSSCNDFFSSHTLDYLLYSEKEVYFPKNSLRIKRFRDYNQLAQKGGSPTIPLIPIEGALAYNPILKILVNEADAQRHLRAKQFINSMPSLHMEQSSEAFFDIMPRGVTKGAATLFLCEYYGISPEQVCSFGDEMNDISMFKESGLSICMENANPLVKKYAKKITETNDNGGFAKAIYTYVL